MSCNYQFSMHDDEGVCDLFDIPVKKCSLLADNEELFEEDAESGAVPMDSQ